MASFLKLVRRIEYGWQLHRTTLLMFLASAVVAFAAPAATYHRTRDLFELGTLAAFIVVLVPLFVRPLFPKIPELAPEPTRFRVGISDRSSFWPRRAEAAKVVQLIQKASVVTVVCGLSGAGKSVLIQNDVLPALEQDGWDTIRIQTYGDDLQEDLLRQLIAKRILVPNDAEGFKRSGTFRPRNKIAIVFDQAERLLHSSAVQNQWMISFLQNARDPIRCVLVVRDDQYYRLKGLGVLPPPSEAAEVKGIAATDDLLARLQDVAQESVARDVIQYLQALASATPSSSAALPSHLQMIGLMFEELKGSGGTIAYAADTGEFGTVQLLRRYLTSDSSTRPLFKSAVLFALSQSDPRWALEPEQLERLTYYSPAEAEAAVDLLLKGLGLTPASSAGAPPRTYIADLLASLSLDPVTAAGKEALRMRANAPVSRAGVLPIHIQMVGVMLEDLSQREGGRQIDDRIFASEFGTLGLLHRYFKRYLSSSPSEQVASAVLFALSTGDPRRRLRDRDLVQLTYYSRAQVGAAVGFLIHHGLITSDGAIHELAHDTLAVLFRDFSGLYMNAAQRDGIAYVADKPSKRPTRLSKVLIDDSGDDQLNRRRWVTRLLFGFAGLISLARMAGDYIGWDWWHVCPPGASTTPVAFVYWPFGIAHLAGGVFIYNAVQYFMRIREDPSPLRYWVIPFVGMWCMLAGTLCPDLWLLMLGVTGGLVGLKWLILSHQNDLSAYSKAVFCVQARNYLSFAIVVMLFVGGLYYLGLPIMLQASLQASGLSPAMVETGARLLALVVATGFLVQKPDLAPYLSLLDRVHERR